MLYRRFLYGIITCLLVFNLSHIIAQDEIPALTAVPTQALIPTPLLTETATDLPTQSPTVNSTPLPTETPTNVPSETPLPTPTETLTDVPTATATETPTATVSESPAPTLTDTTPTSTSADFTATMTPILTETTTETATAVVTPTVTASATQSTLPPEPPLSLTLIDSFDAPILVNWMPNPAWSIVAENGGQAVQTHTGSPLTFSTYMLPFLYEVAVELRVRFSAGVFRMDLRQSSAGDYAAELNANGQVNLYRLGQLISTTTVTPTVTGQWRTFRLSAVDDVVRLSIDGAEVAGFIDAVPLARGGLTINASGLAGDGLTIDDMKLWWYDRTQQRSNTQTNAATFNKGGANVPVGQSFTVPNIEAITYISTTTGIPNSNQLYSVYGVNTVAHPLIQGTIAITTSGQPTWSPTLPLLAYSCTGTDTATSTPIQGICIGKVDSALQQVAIISIGGINTINPRWSPDGTRLAWEQTYTYTDGFGYSFLTSQIYQAGIGLQNGNIQIISPPTLLMSNACLPQFQYMNANTMDWEKNGYLYFGINSGAAGFTSVGFYRFNGQNVPAGSCPTIESVVGINDIAGFNGANNSQFTMDTHSSARVKQNGDLLFGDLGGNVMLYRPAAPANALFKRAIDLGGAYGWSPDETQVAFIRRFISGGLPDALFVKNDPYDNDSSNSVQLTSGTAPNRDKGSTWNVPHLTVQSNPTITPTPTPTPTFVPTLTPTATVGSGCQIQFKAELNVRDKGNISGFVTVDSTIFNKSLIYSAYSKTSTSLNGYVFVQIDDQNGQKGWVRVQDSGNSSGSIVNATDVIANQNGINCFNSLPTYTGAFPSGWDQIARISSLPSGVTYPILADLYQEGERDPALLLARLAVAESNTASPKGSMAQDRSEVELIAWTVRMRAFFGFIKYDPSGSQRTLQLPNNRVIVSIASGKAGDTVSLVDEIILSVIGPNSTLSQINPGYQPIRDIANAGIPSNSTNPNLLAAFYPQDDFALGDLYDAYWRASRILGESWSTYNTNIIGLDSFFGPVNKQGEPLTQAEIVLLLQNYGRPVNPPSGAIPGKFGQQPNQQNMYFDLYDADNYFLITCVPNGLHNYDNTFPGGSHTFTQIGDFYVTNFNNPPTC